jgi:Ala-tRNA(Pro) deacylase
MKTRADLINILEQLKIPATTVDHPAVFTVAESAEIDRLIPGGHTKNLFLKDPKGKLWLVVAHAHTEVDLKALSRRAGAGRFSFGRAERLREVLGVSPGSVTVFALINDEAGSVSVILDEALMAFDTINGHPLENVATTNIARDDLLRFIRACGHEPRVLYLGRDAPGAPNYVEPKPGEPQ